MDNFKILVCEDDDKDLRNIKHYLNEVKKEFTDTEITYKEVNFEDIYHELSNEYDLLILDLFDEFSEDNAGENVLLHNYGNKNIPTLIYTAAGDSLGFEFNSNKSKYPFLKEKLTKLYNSGENIKDFMRCFIIEKGSKKYYTQYNSNDTNLNLGIELIGKTNFNSILFQISKKYTSDNIIVFPMTSGWSGAVLFKLEILDNSFILKVSNNIESIKEEHKKGKELYHRFPDHLTTHIEHDEYISCNKTALGILIKNVSDSLTLYDFVADKNNSQQEIDKMLKDIFLSPKSLGYHYQTQTSEEVDWTSIFENINEVKISWIQRAYEELKPIILKYYQKINIQDLELLCIYHKYQNLDKTKLLISKHKSKLILSHGDMHAKNILIQDRIRPVIIDTGALGFQHWSLDISRLFANIFTLGIHADTVDYFDLETIPTNIELLERILNENTTEVDRENNIVLALKWLKDNLTKIFGDSINLFEFYLGLAKEFLQISYRFDTIPPNKRAEALIIAHKLIGKANMSVEL